MIHTGDCVEVMEDERTEPRPLVDAVLITADEELVRYLTDDELLRLWRVVVAVIASRKLVLPSEDA